MMLSNGDIVDGYKIIRAAVAKGGTGIVHEVSDQEGCHYALKILNRAEILARLQMRHAGPGISDEECKLRAQAGYERLVKRFKEEYQILIGLNHPHVARAYSLGFYKDHFYFTSEFVTGETIGQYLRDKKWREMIPIFVQVLEGLDFIHKNGLIHLDIKSDNILIQTIDGLGVAKVIDFGLARSPTEYGGEFFGTISYMPPEIALGWKEKVDARADLFSFGVLMYYCITRGSFPFPRTSSKDPEVVRHIIEKEVLRHPLSKIFTPDEVPPFLDTIVNRLLAKRPEDRFYTNARAVINALTTKMPDAFAGNAQVWASYLIPEDDCHIGHETGQAQMLAAIDAALAGGQPVPAIFAVCGGEGSGKSHLLKKLKERAEQDAEKIHINHLRLPASRDWLEKWTAGIVAQTSDNDRPLIILIDDIDEILNHEDGPLPNMIKGIIRLLTEKQSHPLLYKDRQPVLLFHTMDKAAVQDVSGLLFRDAESLIRYIELAPFSREEIVSYLCATPAFKGKTVPDVWVEKLFRRTKGVPADLVQQLRELDSQGMLFGLDGEIAVAAAAEVEYATAPHLPATTESRLLGQYEHLLDEERAIADVIAVWTTKHITRGPDFASLMQLFPYTNLLHHLNNLVQRDILALHPDGGYIFFNDYMVDVIYQKLKNDERATLHDKIAELLRKKKPSEREAILLHQGLGSDSRRGIPSLIKLAREKLYEGGQARLASELIKQALFVSPDDAVPLKIYLSGLLAEAYFYDGKIEEAEGVLRDALAMARALRKWGGSGLEVFLQIRHVLILLQQKRYQEAETFLDKVIELHKDRKNIIFYLRLLNCRALNLYQQSSEHADRAVDLLTRAHEIYEMSGALEKNLSPQNARRINNNQIGLVLRSLGRLPDAAAELKKKLAEKEHTIFSQIATSIALAETYRMLGDYENAETLGRKVIELARTSRLGELLMHAHGLLANLYHDMNRFDDAIAESNRFLAASGCLNDEQRHRAASIRLWVHMGHCYKEKKNWDMALLHFDAAIEAGAQSYYLMSAYEGMGEVFYHKGENDEKALEYFTLAEGLLDKLPADAVAISHRFRILKIRAEMFIKQGNIEEGKTLLSTLKKLAGEDAARLKECAALEALL